MQAVERASQFTMRGDDKPEVTTSLTGAFGDTWDQADTVLGATKEANQADRSLARDGRPGSPKRRGETARRSTSTRTRSARARELRKYPSAAGLAVVGTLMATESDNENIKRAGRAGDGARRAVGDRLGAHRGWRGLSRVEARRAVAQVARGHEAAVRAFNPDALLTPEVRTRSAVRARACAWRRARDGVLGEGEGARPRGRPRGLRRVGERGMGRHGEAQREADDRRAVGRCRAERGVREARAGAGRSGHVARVGGDRELRRAAPVCVLRRDGRAGRAPGGAATGGRTARITATKTRTLDIPIREAQARSTEARATGDAAKIADAQSKLGEAQAVQQVAARRARRDSRGVVSCGHRHREGAQRTSPRPSCSRRCATVPARRTPSGSKPSMSSWRRATW
jgi:hypothetical protein